jgi:hypothetical protein
LIFSGKAAAYAVMPLGGIGFFRRISLDDMERGLTASLFGMMELPFAIKDGRGRVRGAGFAWLRPVAEKGLPRHEVPAQSPPVFRLSQIPSSVSFASG